MSEKTDLNAISHDLHAVRKEKLALLRAAGEDPFRAEWEQTHVSAECPALLPEGVEAGPAVPVAGRSVSLRPRGQASLVKPPDRTGHIQPYSTPRALGSVPTPGARVPRLHVPC